MARMASACADASLASVTNAVENANVGAATDGEESAMGEASTLFERAKPVTPGPPYVA